MDSYSPNNKSSGFFPGRASWMALQSIPLVLQENLLNPDHQ